MKITTSSSGLGLHLDLVSGGKMNSNFLINLKQIKIARESRWLIETSAQFYAGQYDKTRYYRNAYAYTTVNPHLALWHHYAYEVTTCC